MRFIDKKNQRRIKVKFAWLPIKCDNNEIAWLEKVMIYQTCEGFAFPYNRWVTNAVLPTHLKDDITTGKYSHPAYLLALANWEDQDTEYTP